MPLPARAGTPKRVAVLACSSERYFGPALQAIGARPIAMTRTFMAPEAYLLDALIDSAARGQDPRDALVAAYAKYQRIPRKSADSVFSRLRN